MFKVRRDRSSSVTMLLHGRCWSVTTNEMTYVHNRWRHGLWSRFVLSQASALEFVMTLDGNPIKKGRIFFKPTTKDSSSRGSAAR